MLTVAATTEPVAANTATEKGAGSDTVKIMVPEAPSLPNVSLAQTVTLCVPGDKPESVVFPLMSVFSAPFKL